MTTLHALPGEHFAVLGLLLPIQHSNLFQIHVLLHVGPAEEEQKVYLSPATLLVLPPTLISHWLHQIRVHMKPCTLRVAVLSGDRGSSDDSSSGWQWDVQLHADKTKVRVCRICRSSRVPDKELQYGQQ